MDNATKTKGITKVGIVVSDAMDKTVVIKVESLVMHKLYHRFVQRARKFIGARRDQRLQGRRQGADHGVPSALPEQAVPGRARDRAGFVRRRP